MMRPHRFIPISKTYPNTCVHCGRMKRADCHTNRPRKLITARRWTQIIRGVW